MRYFVRKSMEEAMRRELALLLEKARRVVMTEGEIQAQRRSFAFGNAGFENPVITRQMIDEEDEARKSAAA
jgi:hypothetical protein